MPTVSKLGADLNKAVGASSLVGAYQMLEQTDANIDSKPIESSQQSAAASTQSSSSRNNSAKKSTGNPVPI